VEIADETQSLPVDKSLTQTTLVGGAWATLTSLTTKILGGIKIVILARILSPEDFGLVGLALAAVGTMNLVSNPGIFTALIQKKEIDQADLNVGFWIHAGRGCLLFLLFLVLADWLANFYQEPRLRIILWATSLTFLLDGFQSIGMVRLNRTLDFRRIMWAQMAANWFSFVVAIVLAWTLRSAWALVGSHITQWVILLIMSYVLEPFRPNLRINWTRAKVLIRFGRYVFAAVICYIIITRGSDLLLGKMIGVESYGYYALALSLMGVLSGLTDPLITSVVLPALSQIQEDRQRFSKAFAKIFRTAMLLTAPLFITAAIFGRDLIWLLLGTKWMPMVGPLIWLCLLGWFRSLVLTFDSALKAIGKPELEARLRGIELLLFAVGIIPAIRWYGASGAAAYLFLIYVISFLLHIRVTHRYVPGALKAVVEVCISFTPLFVGQAITAWFRWYRHGSSTWSEGILLGILYAIYVSVFLLMRERELLSTIMRVGFMRKVR